jgi:hypothetical protein
MCVSVQDYETQNLTFDIIADAINIQKLWYFADAFIIVLLSWG